jgi:hypothetical protein
MQEGHRRAACRAPMPHAPALPVSLRGRPAPPAAATATPARARLPGGRRLVAGFRCRPGRPGRLGGCGRCGRCSGGLAGAGCTPTRPDVLAPGGEQTVAAGGAHHVTHLVGSVLQGVEDPGRAEPLDERLDGLRTDALVGRRDVRCDIAGVPWQAQRCRIEAGRRRRRLRGLLRATASRLLRRFRLRLRRWPGGRLLILLRRGRCLPTG